MNNCAIGDNGAKALAVALKRCKSIERLYLNFNPISVEASIELFVAAGSPEDNGVGPGEQFLPRHHIPFEHGHLDW